MFRKTLGNYGELLARNILEEQGYQIIETHFQTRYGEIDLIAEHQGELVFIEVKTRVVTTFGSGLEAITRRKKRSLIRTALCYLQSKNYRDYPCRFDILALTLNQQGEHLRHELITNAFGVEGGNYY
ncbi:MAG: YraN family protein [Firmicutes bacterium]|nr:YraN family protein [Bacillota bacterium]